MCDGFHDHGLVPPGQLTNRGRRWWVREGCQYVITDIKRRPVDPRAYSIQSTPQGPWGVGASAGPVAAGLTVVSGRGSKPYSGLIRVGSRVGKGLTLVRYQDRCIPSSRYTAVLCAYKGL